MTASLTSIVNTTVIIAGGASLCVAAFAIIYIAGSELIEHVSRRWRSLWRAHTDYGWIRAARYRTGIRLLHPYLEARWLDKKSYTKHLRDNVSTDDPTDDPIELDARARRRDWATYGLMEIEAIRDLRANHFPGHDRFMGRQAVPDTDDGDDE